MSDQSLQIKDHLSEKESNLTSLGKTREKFSQSEVMKNSVKGRL